MSNAIQSDVQALVQKELNSANEKFPQFHSAHEGYAVILEEVEETHADLNELEKALDILWRNGIKENNIKFSFKQIATIKAIAVNLTCEAIQVAAMAQKFLDMGDKPNE